MPRPEQLVRPRLLTLLEESSDHKATLISAPAGYGKTTLLALAESIPYEGPLPDGTASVESGAALVRGVFGYGGVQAMAGAIQNAAELESKQISPRTVLACLGLGLNFYGFIGGEDNQWYPSLCEGTTPIEPPKTPEEGYHLTEDLADHAVTWVRKQKTLAPDKPFFMYFAPGATHAPLHVPEEWIEKYKGKFAHGCDRQRELTFARQKELGVIPQDADLTERHEEIPAWDDTDDDLKPILERGMEIYAGFMSHVDHHVGRLLDTIEELGIMDDTLIYLIIGDNGASAEGTHNGSFNEMISLNGMAALETPEFLAAHLDEFGGPKAYTHYAIGSGLTTYPRRCERSYTSCSACS